MIIIRLTLSALIIVQLTHENGQLAGLAQKSPNVEIWTRAGLTRDPEHLRDGVQGMTTKKTPITEGRIHRGITQESSTVEGRIHEGIAQKTAPTTEGIIHVDVTQETPTTKDGMHNEATQESPSQNDTFREISHSGSETSSLSDVTLTPYRWLCVRGGKHSIQVHCNCDPLCVLYGDCCYGVTDNATVCAASVRLGRTHDTMQSAAIPGTNVTKTLSDSTTSTASPNKTSLIKGNKEVDPVSISLAQKSSCRRIPALKLENRQNTLPYMDMHGLSFWMVDQCPSSWLEEESLVKCTDISNTSLTEDAILYQPVTDPDTMITFRNKYCAACNGIKGTGEPWELAVISTRAFLSDITNCSSSICVLRKIRDRRGDASFLPKPEWNLRTCFREAEDDTFGPCEFSFINGSVLRVPRPLPLHSALRDACMAYNNPVVVYRFDASYKNYHCILCYIGDFTLWEDQNCTPPPVRYFGLSLRALLYLGDQDKKQSDDVMPADQQIVCPPGFIPEAQDCRPLAYNFTVVKSIVSLHFEPCGWVPTLRDDCGDIRKDGRLAAVLRAVPARMLFCGQKHGANNTSITFVLDTMVTLHVRLAHSEEGRNAFNHVQAWMENALQNAQLKISGRPVGVRSGSFSACMKHTTDHSAVTPFHGASTLSTPRQSRGNIPVGNGTVWLLMALVAAVWDF